MKAFISCLLILSAIQAKAESIKWNPEQVRKVLAEAERDGQIENLKIILTPQVIETLEQYDGGVDTIRMRGGSEDSTGNPLAIAPALASAAAAGAAVAVVEYVWDKYAGNGGSLHHDELMTPGQFDLTVTPTNTPPAISQLPNVVGFTPQPPVVTTYLLGMPSPPKPSRPSIYPVNPVSPCVCPSTPGVPPIYVPERSMQNPAALTPAAVIVAEATAGAVAYKAAEYLLNKYGNLTNEDIQIINPNYFDLNPALQQ